MVSPRKNRPFAARLGFALAGLVTAWRNERSFRTQAVCAALALAGLAILRPAPVWWALVLIACGAVVAAELFNTAVEALADRLHPDEHPAIRVVKDCAAAAVLVAAATALGVALAMVLALWRHGGSAGMPQGRMWRLHAPAELVGLRPDRDGGGPARGMAQSGSASALGAEGRGFESLCPDQSARSSTG